MSLEPRVSRQARVRVFLGCLASALAAGALASTLGVAEGLGQRIAELSPQNFSDGWTLGIVLGSVPGFILGALSQKRLARTGRTRILWTSLIHSFVLTFLPVFLLVFVATASSAAC